MLCAAAIGGRVEANTLKLAERREAILNIGDGLRRKNFVAVGCEICAIDSSLGEIVDDAVGAGFDVAFGAAAALASVAGSCGDFRGCGRRGNANDRLNGCGQFRRGAGKLGVGKDDDGCF